MTVHFTLFDFFNCQQAAFIEIPTTWRPARRVEATSSLPTAGRWSSFLLPSRTKNSSARNALEAASFKGQHQSAPEAWTTTATGRD